MSSTLEASVFMGKNYSDNLHSIKNTKEDLTLKQMFDISEKLIVEQSDEIFGVSQISSENSPWKQLSLVNDEEVPMEFEWNLFPGITSLQLVDEVQKFMNKMSDPAQFQGRIIFMSMFNEIVCRSEDKELKCNANARHMSVFAKRFPA